MTETRRSAREVVERFLDAAADPAGRGLAGLYGTPAVIEMPFAPPGVPERSETGEEELRARFARSAKEREYHKVDSVRIHETTDPEVVIAEYRVHGRVVATGRPFVLPFICVITVRDGRIVHSRDYANPVAGAVALGRVPALVAELTREDGPPVN